MNDKDRQVLPSLNGDADLPERLWLYDDFAPEEDQPAADYASGLASVGFIGAAVRRSWALLCAAAVLGLVLGFGFDVMSPPAYQASTTVLLTHGPNDNPVDAMQTDTALAESQSVAQRVVQQLHLSDSVSTFRAAVTVTPITDRVLLMTVSAPSSAQAVARAKALAAQFLQFRAAQLQTQQQLLVAGLQQQISLARQHIASLTTQIGALSAQPVSAARQAESSKLTTQRTDAITALSILQQTTAGQQASGLTTMMTEVKGSQVLDAAAPIHRSALKYAVIYTAMGLFAGLVLGLAFVVIRALVSDRLRRRDDVADALGAPVSLSTGSLDAPRWLPDRPRTKAVRSHDMQRIITNLHDVARKNSPGGITALAVVPVDSEKIAARSLVALAISCAQEGQQVVVADLCPGAPAARLLGVKKPGVHTIRVDGGELAVSVPRRDDIIPVGPFRHARPRSADGQADAPPDAAFKSADVLLTLASVDPSLGAEHLRTWATSAAVLLTAGRSSWMRIHSVGELIRLARIPLVSAILVGTDKTDESLGVAQPDLTRSPAARLNGS